MWLCNVSKKFDKFDQPTRYFNFLNYSKKNFWSRVKKYNNLGLLICDKYGPSVL